MQASAHERPRIGCAILAAGGSSRLGRAKQLLSYRGVPLIRHVGALALATGCDAVAVVTGSGAPEVARAVRELALELLDNPDWREGVAASIRVASAWATQRALDALLLTACDQVHLTSAHLEQLIAYYENHTSVIASAYADTVGIPVLFGAAWFGGLLQLEGDRGAGALLRAHAPTQLVAWPAGEFDIDSELDVERTHGLLR
jgi:molybdenum cofactor cytidylyltransferase